VRVEGHATKILSVTRGNAPETEKTMPDSDLSPPRPLSTAAREIWDAHAARIDSEARWGQIDHDILAAYCETTALYLECLRAVESQGVLVGARTAGQLVKNPVSTVLHQTRDAMLRLARSVPLVDRKAAAEAAEFERFMEEM
jgi:P27 family predicted phage terminase small subunit